MYGQRFTPQYRESLKALNNKVPLIGFIGSPWTIATYMIEGRKTDNFTTIKTMMYQHPKLLHSVLNKLMEVVRDFAQAQIDAGVEMVQVFDTWGGVLGREKYKEFSLLYLNK